MKKARAAEARLWSLIATHGVVAACVKDVQIACVQAIALYGCELWWHPQGGSRHDFLQLLLSQQARSALGALPTTPRGTLLRDSGLTPAVVALDARQQLLVSRLASGCEGSKAIAFFDYPTPGAQVGRVAAIELARGCTAETLCWPDPGEKPAVETTVLEDDATEKRAAELWVQSKQCKAGSGTWSWWTDGSPTNVRIVGAADVCLNGDSWTDILSYLGTVRMEISTVISWQSESHSDSQLREQKC
jgi:hypothetical protein